MTTRDIVIDGELITGVPEGVTEEELRKRLDKARENEQSGTVEDFATGVAVGFSELGGNLLEAGADVGELVAGDNRMSEYLRSLSDEQEEAANFFRERGEDSPWASTLGEMVPLVAGFGTAGGAAYIGLKALGAGSFTSGVASGIAVDQIYADPDENIANAVEDYFGENIEGTWAETVVDALAANEDDTLLQKRGKLVLEGAVLGGVFDSLLRTPELFGWVKDKTGRAYTSMTESEKAQQAWQYLKEKMPEPDPNKNLGPEVVKNPETGEFRFPNEQERNYRADMPNQIYDQTTVAGKIKQKIFTSRGYLEPKAYNAFEGSLAAKRQLDTKAEHIALRIRSIMGRIPEEEAAKNTANITRAFNEGIKFLDGVAPEKRAAEFARYHDINPEIAEEVLEARDLIDQLSETILGTNVVSPEAKQIIADNIGKYTTRSYRLFEDVNYKPTDKVRANAENYFTDRYSEQNPLLSLDEAQGMARGTVAEILGETTQEERTFFDAATRINKGIFQGRKDIDAPVRELLGEITDPSEKIILSVHKMGQVTETYKFLDTMKQLGKDKYIFDAKSNPDFDFFNAKIEGTNSSLDGLYTTPEVRLAIKNRESRLFNLADDPKASATANAIPSFYRKFLATKAFSQKSKTIYSHVTQLRNVLGGLQFGVANGMNPFSGETRNVFKILKNEIGQGGDKALNAAYERYQGLGIINTNVRVNEFRELMDTAVTADQDKMIAKLQDLSERYGAVKRADQVLEQTYMATDDFFKINGFHNELEVLKKANPGTPIEALELEAAEIIRNTFPNYDRVPKGLKSLKELPVGNFFSFPAEITRTSVNIIRQASKEIVSGNDALKARGIKRLSGYLGQTGFWGSVGYSSAALMGMTAEEKRAADKTTEAPWSKESERMYFRDSETGEIWANDTQFLNSYSAITEPVIAVAQSIYDGELAGHDLDEYLAKAVGEGFKKTLTPYLSGSIITSAISDVFFAAASDDGRTPNGKALFQPGTDTIDNLIDGTGHVLASVVPGTAVSAKGLYDAAIGEVHPTGGHKIKDLPSELVTNLLGIRFSRVNPEFNLKSAATGYSIGSQDLVNYQPKFNSTPEELIEQYVAHHKEDYRMQQELYKQFQATATLVGTGQAYMQLEEVLGEEKAMQMLGGFFMPKKPSEDFMLKLFSKTFSDVRHDYDTVSGTEQDTVEKLINAYAQMVATDLTTLDTVKEDEEGKEYVDEEDKRILKAEGGYVSQPVPRAPLNPSQRINKITGQPYSDDAGVVIEDETDPLRRLGFMKGGWVTREQYALGGLVKKLAPKAKELFESVEADDAAILKASESLAGNPITEEDLVTPFRVSYMNSNKSTPKARLDKLGTRDAGNFDDVLPIESEEAQRIIAEQGLEVEEGKTHLIVQNIVKQSKDESPITTNYAIADVDDIKAIYDDSNRSLYTSKSALNNDPDELAYSEAWRQLDDADVYRNVIPQGRSALENLAAKSDLQPDTIKTMMEFVVPDNYKADFLNLLNEEALDADTLRLLEETVVPVPKPRQMAMNNEKDPTEFLKGSKVSKPVFRGTTSDEPNRDFLISMLNPREIGTHLGATPEQANSIIIKHIGDRVGEKPVTTMGAIESEMNRKGLPEGAQVTKYLVSIKNPLKINSDVSDWDARAIIASIVRDADVKTPKSSREILESIDNNPTFWETVNAGPDVEDEVMQYVEIKSLGYDDPELAEYLYESGVDLDELDSYIDSEGFEGSSNAFIQAIEKQTGKSVDVEALEEIYDQPLEVALGGADTAENVESFISDTIEQYEVNRAFREYLKGLGFDGIDYKNMGEPTKAKGSDRSYIVFDPEQIKLTTGGKTKGDPRVSKAYGGRVQARLRKRYGGVVGQETGVRTSMDVINPAMDVVGPPERHRTMGPLGNALHRKLIGDVHEEI